MELARTLLRNRITLCSITAHMVVFPALYTIMNLTPGAQTDCTQTGTKRHCLRRHPHFSAVDGRLSNHTQWKLAQGERAGMEEKLVAQRKS